MKFALITASVLIFAIHPGFGQVKLGEQDFANLVSISELYSESGSGNEFNKSVESLRTPKLNHIVDILIAAGRGNESILDPRFLTRPSDEELMMWYVIREIHYNRSSKTRTNKTSSDVAKEILSKAIDSRWLLDNYYYRIHGGIASLFNTTDLSKNNFELDRLGFKDKTERAIFFLDMIDSLVGGRFQVLYALNNKQKILEFAGKLPKFNGQEYYRFKDFDYDDFDWIGYEKTESYNTRHIGMLYTVLLAHSEAVYDLKGKDAARDIYFNSILHDPTYFKFSGYKDQLQKLYDGKTPDSNK